MYMLNHFCQLEIGKNQFAAYAKFKDDTSMIYEDLNSDEQYGTVPVARNMAVLLEILSFSPAA